MVVPQPRWKGSLLVASLLLLVSVTAEAQEGAVPPASQDTAPDNSKSIAASRLVVVVGAAGEPEYGKQFSQWADRWQQVAHDAAWQWQAIGDTADSNGQTGATAATTDLGLLEAEIAAWKDASAQSSMTYVLVLIGHGTSQKGEAKFNLRGPDLSAKQLADWLAPVSAKVVVISCASASSPFINRLSGKDRMIVTATKNEQETNFCRFGGFLPEALLDPKSDLDHDDEVSLVEAVISAANQTRDFYLSEDRIQMEHALLDDNGDTLGSPVEALAAMMRGESPEMKPGRDPLPRVWDGAEAVRLVFPNLSRSTGLLADEERRRTELENEVLRLRRSKKSLEEADYYEQMERSLLKLSELYEEVDKRQEKQSKSP